MRTAGAGRRSRRVTVLAAVAAVLSIFALLGGCAAGPSTGTQIGTRTGTPTVTPREKGAAPRAPVDPLAAETRRRVDEMTLPEKIASLLMLHQPGTDAAALRDFAASHGLGGLILMGDNMPASPEALGAVTRALSVDPALPLLIGIDQEGGEVSRLPGDSGPGAAQLRSLPVPHTEAAFRSRSALLQTAGVGVNFGIVADVTADPTSFLFGRVLGTDPASAADRVGAAVAGERGRVLSTLKHFPGHGAAPGDSHRSIPVSDLGYEEWREQVAPPFQAGIAAGAEFVMLGHLTYPAIAAGPASLSPVWHRILRRDLGFTGVIISDDLLMLQYTGAPEFADPTQNAIAALAAGSTMLLYVLPADPGRVGIDIPGLVDGISSAVAAGRIPETQIDDAAFRLLLLRSRLAAGS